jgi:hypothetical protein
MDKAVAMKVNVLHTFLFRQKKAQLVYTATIRWRKIPCADWLRSFNWPRASAQRHSNFLRVNEAGDNKIDSVRCVLNAVAELVNRLISQVMSWSRCRSITEETESKTSGISEHAHWNFDAFL